MHRRRTIIKDSELTTKWQTMSLTTPAAPTKSTPQKTNTTATLNGTNPWKSTNN